MPFHGRPSDACGPCRKGRLRCDRARPSCTQCIRKSIICSGYRKVALLLFKDESESTARKVQWEKNGEIYQPPSTRPTNDFEPITVTLFNHTDLPSPSRSITPSQDDRALAYFMSSYIPASPFYYLSEVYKTTTPIAQDAVSSTILAASLASLSLHVGSSKLMENARTHYSEALAQTNAALASPNTAILDRTLISVLTLGLFEAIAFSSRRSPESWTTHTLGAVQLIRLRGNKQLKTSLGTRLFLQTCNNIRSSCIARSTPLPNEFVYFCEQAKPFLDHSIPNARLGPLMDNIISLRVQLMAKHIGTHQIPALIHETLQLDEQVLTLMDMLPPSWRYEAMPQHRIPSWAYQGLAHTYADHRISRHWNTLHQTRLFANEVVWHLAAHVAWAKQHPELCLYIKDFDAEALQATAEANRTQVIGNIFASVPHFLGEEGTAFGPAARFLIWPLTIVAERKLTPEPARRYATWCLYEIARQARIPQALHAAEAIKSEASTDWMHLFVLG
ncbi:hypothetical protein BKA65DRAFT_167940 [Rhexocercosporidium sp. MPI-PUGE-AT-0058]|nr:hypothetical protein BKA65DRAFT_167940 [Rhexocercosporidium sp. MPI-PUGE-AT-0058]